MRRGINWDKLEVQLHGSVAAARRSWKGGWKGASLQRDAHCGDEEIEQETTKVAFRAIKNYFPFFGAIKNKNSTRELGGAGGWGGLGRAVLLATHTID